jgi:hypothetical protein
MLRSKWCPLHRQEHAKEQARERQRRHRQKETEAGQDVAGRPAT